MVKWGINIQQAPIELQAGLEVLLDHLFFDFSGKKTDHQVRFEKIEKGLQVKIHAKEIQICYSTLSSAFRALGIIQGKLKAGKPVLDFQETEFFDLTSVMLDVSRNACPKLDVLKDFCKKMALMGLNSLVLYAETNYEIPGEALFGYNVGKYSIDQLTELRQFNEKIGIEMFPCIQTLAHLRRLLHWEKYSDIKDTDTVMMVDDEKTYAFIDKMVSAAIKPFTSKRIHIGMDEAWDLGLGNFLRKKGYTHPHEIMNRHLGRVLEIMEKYSLKPMMWADMFFRAGSVAGDYYDKNAMISEKIKASIPSNVSLVYWDYYHFDKSDYLHWIEKHQALSKDAVCFATGLQNWNRFWTNYPYAFATVGPGLEACKEKGVKEVIMTAWGDDGNECNFHSMLPALQFYAEHSYNKTVCPADFEDNLLGSCDILFKEWETAGKLDRPGYIAEKKLSTNISKTLLWEDPLFGPFQFLIKGKPVVSHFQDISNQLLKVSKRKKRLQKELLLPQLLACLLSVKADFPARLYEAYKRKDRGKLVGFLKKDIPFMKKMLDKLWKTHRLQWFETYMPFGWETLEVRYGGLATRLETTENRIRNYLSGKIKNIEELDYERLITMNVDTDSFPTIGYLQGFSATPTPINWGNA